jgi:hypothetical protein
MSEQIDFEELIDELVRAAQDVTASFEQGTGVAGAERELDEVRKKFVDTIELLIDERDSLVSYIKRIADSLQCHPSMALNELDRRLDRAKDELIAATRKGC